MTANYAKTVSTKSTDQRDPVHGKNQVKNNAGGYVFQVDKWTRLERFLILGHEGGTYYATQKKLTYEVVSCLDECLQEDYNRTIHTIVDISKNGRAPKNDPAIFALAYVAGKVGTPASLKALEHLNDVCRIGTHLFDFCESVQQFRGWGNSLCKAVSGWYLNRSPLALAKQVTKYKQRNGWSQRDVLRKAHPKADGLLNEVFKYVTQHEKWCVSPSSNPESGTYQFLCAVDQAQHAPKNRLIQLIHDHGLVREHIPTEMLNEKDVWEALLVNMPLTALIRNLGKMSSIGLLKPLSSAISLVQNKLNKDEIKAQRLHPVTTLIALSQYQQGRGDKGSLNWKPVPQVIDILEGAFVDGFETVEPTGLSYYLGVDCSGSMSVYNCAGAQSLTCCEGAACMALLTAKTEPNYYIRGFASKGDRWSYRGDSAMRDLNITRNDTLTTAGQKAQLDNFGATDCALPILDAMENDLDVDVFCIYTDNETWAGEIHPFQALQQYRKKTGKMAKLAVFGMVDNNFTIADPSDAGMMDFQGFDSSCPSLLANFALS